MFLEFNLGCEYIRERKKRGKASRKDLAQQAAAAAAASVNGHKSANGQSDDGISDSRMGNGSSDGSNDNQDPHRPESRSMSLENSTESKSANIRKAMKANRARSLGNLTETPHQHQMSSSQDHGIPHDMIDSSGSIGLNGYGSANGYNRPVMQQGQMINNGSTSYGTSALPGYAEIPYSIQSPNYPGNAHSPATAFRMAESPIGGYPMDSPSQSGPSPGWMSLPSPITHHNFNYSLRYPVLQPLIPHLGTIVPLNLACDLLDLYFASSSSAQMHPMSPYVLGYVYRKRSFLHPTKPRHCSPALLASILWVAAQTSDAAFLTSPPSARGRVCQRLLELTVGLLKPLIHGPPAGESSQNFSDTVINGVALGGLGVALPGTVGADAMSGESGAFGAAGALDDVVTYIHLATVVSASEYKGASLRWWNAAWSLARELKLGRELPPSPQTTAHGADVDADGEADDDLDVPHPPSSPGSITEEEREERRRIWWLVYTVDRHLSLCYNKPLFLLDVECDGLQQPMDDTLWQAGEFYSGDCQCHSINSPSNPTQNQNVNSGAPSIGTRDFSQTQCRLHNPHLANTLPKTGPNFECTGHSIFGYFLPLMTILGEIVDLNHAKNHPRFGVGFRSAQEWDDHEAEITAQLEAYGRSLKEFERANLHIPEVDQPNIDPTRMGMGGAGGVEADTASPGAASVHTNTSRTSRMTVESDVQTRIVLAYGTHVMHVLHILLTGKWDPITLLDDNDLWISSQSFINATGHAVSAAEAIESILEYDPGLEFMPFFFGVYLLQGSFLLLLIADKLQSEASPSVVKACEMVVRAHEACVVTLNTEYQVCFPSCPVTLSVRMLMILQRNFRKVMRSALAQVKGRVPEDFGEQQLRRRDVLSLYRWVGNGTGLAL